MDESRFDDGGENDLGYTLGEDPLALTPTIKRRIRKTLYHAETFAKDIPIVHRALEDLQNEYVLQGISQFKLNVAELMVFIDPKTVTRKLKKCDNLGTYIAAIITRTVRPIPAYEGL